MADIQQAREMLIARILEGHGQASHAERRAAFDNAVPNGPLATLMQKIARRAYEVTDADIAAARASGISEDQLFELAVCAAVGEASRQYEAALTALEAATKVNGHAPRDPR
jgi:hypothetical protein